VVIIILKGAGIFPLPFFKNNNKMRKVFMKSSGEVWNVTSRHADQLVAEGKAKYYEDALKEKEEKKAIETKEEKAPKRTKKK
jgi:hypothetical protein